MQEAEIDIGKIDNDEYLASLPEAQKNLVDNYNASVCGSSLENTLKNIGINNGRVLNKLISMSISQKHTKAPGFGYYVNLYDFFTLIIWFLIVVGIPWLMLQSIEESFAREDLKYILIRCVITFIFGLAVLLSFVFVRLFVKDKITKSLIINNVYYYLHDFYGIGDDVKDSRVNYEDRMKIKSRAFLLYGLGKMHDQVKNNIYMVGIGKGIESILDLVSRCIVVTHPLWVSLRNGARMIQVCQEHNIRDYAIAFNAVPMEGEDLNLYDMLEVLRAEYVGAMIPYDEDVLTYTQEGHLLELVSKDLKSVLAPLVDYVVTGDCWEDYDVQKQFDDYVANKKASKAQASTPSLATTGKSIFDDSSNVHYINRGGWTTQRLLVQGKQSLWRRRKLN